MHYGYSDKTLIEFARFIEDRYTHTELDALFLELSVPDEWSHGKNKLDRVIKLIKKLKEYEDNDRLENLLSTVVSQTQAFLKRIIEGEDSKVAENFLMALRADGIDIMDGLLVPLDGLAHDLEVERNLLHEVRISRDGPRPHTNRS